MTNSLTPAQIAANNLSNQVSAVVGNLNKALANGLTLPAASPGGTPTAVAAADLQAALGAIGVAQANLLIAANANGTQLAAALAALA
jgi:hypothetical protein